MNLARHASVLWRFRRVTAAGVVIGLILAFLAFYDVSSGSLKPRGTETWTAVSQILVTQPGSASGSLSYALGIHPPPCRINVSGDAAVTAASIDGTYRGASDCTADGIHDGRLHLTR